MRKMLSLAVITALTSSVVLAKEIKIGAVMPMSGPIAAYGQKANLGVELAQKLQPTLKNGDTIKSPHSHDFYVCVLFTKGTGTHQIDFNFYVVLQKWRYFLEN